jgi:hypothetical protein
MKLRRVLIPGGSFDEGVEREEKIEDIEGQRLPGL